jgi:glycosyltransferase involved in cell wall biosynthesis
VVALVSEWESFGNSAAEAVMAGRPVLVTDRCGVAEFLDGAALVVPYERDAIAEGLRRLLSDGDLRASMESRCDAVASKLSWDHVAQEQLRIYRAAIG